MKPQLHKLPLKTDVSFIYQQWDCAYFDKPWHFHEEYELVLIDKSKGTKFIGDHVSLFGEGDLFLLGSNIPHLFRNDEIYYEENNSAGARSYFVHFTQHLFGESFLNLPEMTPVRQLLDQSTFALQILGSTKEKVANGLRTMQEQTPSERLLTLLQLLFSLAESKEVRPLLSTKYVASHQSQASQSHRIQKVLEYAMKNYMHDIYLSEVASLLHMSEASFSRYFKHHTQKTFSAWLAEVRISNACRLMMEGEENISAIGYACGFENLSNFYRHFKKVTGMVPKDYRKKFLKIAT